jgi:CRP-like cAMP-binding protein
VPTSSENTQETPDVLEIHVITLVIGRTLMSSIVQLGKASPSSAWIAGQFMPTFYRNNLLKALSSDCIQRLRLSPLTLPLRLDIESPGTQIHQLIFLEDGIASMTASFSDGSQVEIGVLGYESLLCASALIGVNSSLNRVYMQIAGRGYTTSSANAKLEFARHGEFHDLALRSNQAHFLQTAQTAGCNARHTVEQRLARWLLLCADRMEGPVLNLPHEHIAAMLGCNRSTVTVAAGRLQDDGLILYSRSKIRLTDRAGLERHSCECYRTLFDYLAENVWLPETTSTSAD